MEHFSQKKMFTTILLILLNIASMVSALDNGKYPYRCPDWINKMVVSESSSVVFDEVCYSHHNRYPNTWEGAVTFCEENGGKLVKITTKDLNQFFDRLEWNEFWIGAQQRDGKWYWSDGEPVKFSDWEKDLSPGGILVNLVFGLLSAEPCATWGHRFQIFGSWNTADCLDKMSHVCEHTAVQYDRKSSTANELTTKSAVQYDLISSGFIEMTSLSAVQYDYMSPGLTKMTSSVTSVTKQINGLVSAKRSPSLQEGASKEIQRVGAEKKRGQFKRIRSFNGVEDNWLISEPIDTINTRSSGECAVHCLRQTQFVCTMFNIHQQARICRLYDTTDPEPGEMIAKEGWSLWKAM